MNEIEKLKKTINSLQLQVEQTSKLAVLGKLATDIAHEINNPLMVLTSVTFLAQRYLEQNQHEKLPEKLEKIQNTIMRINRIVNGLRTYARDGEQDPMVPANLKEVILQAIELCSESIRYQNIELTFEDLITDAAIISCRETQISQVLLNLISNSKDAILPLQNKWIKIILSKKEKNIILQVIDSGSGIPIEMREKIFLPFFTTKDVGVGTGLGLSISSEIIKNHQGRLYIDENHPHTCFSMELPSVN